MDRHKAELSATDVASRVVQKMDFSKRPEHGRTAENVLAYAGALQVLFVGVLEGLQHYGMIGQKVVYTDAWQVFINLPWFNVIAIVICVAPKTLGRATVGKYLDRLPFIGTKND